jgi:hypothetical protein
VVVLGCTDLRNHCTHSSGDTEVDDLGRAGADAGAHGTAHQPAHRPAEHEAEQAAPHGAGQRGTAGLRVDRLAHSGVAVVVLADDDGITQLQRTLHGQASGGREELLGAQRIGQRHTHQVLIGLVGLVVHRLHGTPASAATNPRDACVR